MRIVILTSKDHWYATMLLNGLIDADIFAGHRVLIVEEDCLVPGRSFVSGLLRYMRVSGPMYVFLQAIKQYAFVFKRFLAALLGRVHSPCYPYRKRMGKTAERSPYSTIRTPEAEESIGAFKPDCILSLFSKEKVPSSILALAPGKAVNLHPAPLPAYGGVSPTFWALSRGESRFGITLHGMDAGIDTGPVIAQTLFDIADLRTEHAVYLRSVREGVPLVLAFLRACQSGHIPSATPMPSEGKSMFSLPTKDAVRTFHRRGCRFFTLAELFS